MSTINVLSNLGSKSAAESGDSMLNKDINSSDETESAAAEFAAILGGWMFYLGGSKGQGSEELKAGDGGQQASPDSPAMSTIAGISGLELQKVLAGILGFGQTQVLQSNFPAGMEANSGSTKDQGSDSRILAALTTILKDASNLTELDRYKETIVKLWQELSGEIKTFSSQVNQIKALFPGNFQQIEQVLAGLSGGIAQDIDPQNFNNGTVTVQGIKDSWLVHQNQLSAQNLDIKPEGKTQIMDLEGQESGKRIVTGQTEGPSTAPLGEIAVRGNSSRNLLGNLAKEGQEQNTANAQIGGDFTLDSEDAPVVGHSQNADVLWQSGQSEKIDTTTLGGVKVASTPLWDQIASSLRSRRSDVNEFEIQLHPAELGKIQVSLRWKDGLVHLQLIATEAATGNIIQSHLPDLRQSLQNSGVNCGQLQMGLGGEQQQTPQQDQMRYTFKREWPTEEDRAGSKEIPYFLSLQQGEHRINVTA